MTHNRTFAFVFLASLLLILSDRFDARDFFPLPRLNLPNFCDGSATNEPGRCGRLDFQGRSLKGRGADLRKLHLDYSSLWNSRLHEADLSESIFRNSLISGSRFSESSWMNCRWTGVESARSRFDRNDFRSCAWNGAILRDSSFRSADFRDASLAHSRFLNCDLRGADFRGADLGGADFFLTDLSDALYDRKTKLPFPREIAGARGMIDADPTP